MLFTNMEDFFNFHEASSQACWPLVVDVESVSKLEDIHFGIVR